MASAAPGVNLRWNACLGDGGAINRNFACDSNSGSNLLEGSFESGADLTNFHGVEIVLDLATAGTTLPEWWQLLNLGVCRQLALSIQALNGSNCPDWAIGQASMNIAAYRVGYYAPFGPNTARVLLVNGVQPELAQDLTGGREYAVFQLTINSAKTVGSGACAGCLTPVCIVFSTLRVIRAGIVDNLLLSGPTNGIDSFYATWQGGAGVVTRLGQGCPQATPTRNATWGSVKALYR